jgi:hypothetical protein
MPVIDPMTAAPTAPTAPEQTAPVAAPVATDKLTDTQVSTWRARIDRCKRKRKDLIQEWSINVDYRRGKQFDSASDTDRVAVTTDWTQTKAKQAQLFSQVPQVMLTPKHPVFAPAVPVFASKLNEVITSAGVGAAMDEVLPDVINAAGIGAVIVGYESRQQNKTVPRVDTALMDDEAKQAVANSPDLMTEAPEVKDARFYCRRISPGELLWPIEFKGSNFNDAPWLGYTGRMTWAEAKAAFNLQDGDKEQVLGASSASAGNSGAAQDTTLVSNSSDRTDPETDVVEFDEIYYWAARYDPDCYSFTKIKKVTFLRGKTEPVKDEDYNGQAASPDGSYYVGVTRLPINVLTLTYISDEAIPPSDSAVGRPQVDELIKSRSQMIQQRDYSKPMRWFDVNRADPSIIDQLMKGTWQGMIPVNGDGSRAIGEVARAQQPAEDFEFVRIITGELDRSWQVGANQQGTFNQGERSASEAQIVQENFSTRIGYERARVATFFCNVAEVLAGLVALYGDFTTPDIGQDGQQRMSGWNRQAIGNCFVYDIRTDSTVLLDSHQRLQKLSNFLNLTAKSGFVNVEPVLREMAALSGLDPDEVIQKPNPKAPEPPAVNVKVDSETVRDPIILAILVKAGMAPGPQEMEAAKQILINKVEPPQSSGPHPDAATGNAPAGDVPKPGAIGGPIPPEDPTPKWNMADRINQRENDGSNR